MYLTLSLNTLQDLKELIEEHLRLHFTTNQEADEQMLATLPTTLRRRILRHLYGQQLQRCWLLAGVKPKFFDALLGVAKLETFMPQVWDWCLVVTIVYRSGWQALRRFHVSSITF